MDKGHDKDHYPVYQNYLIGGGLMPLNPENIVRPSVGVPLWFVIYKIARKHATNNFHLLQKFVQTLQQFLFTFCKSVGYDGRNF